MGIWQLLQDLASGAAALFRFREKQQELVNTPEMIANAEAKRREEIAADAIKDVMGDDLAKLRKDAGEN
jgi:hypothetical protein